MFKTYGYNPDLIERYVSLLGKKQTLELLQANEKPMKKAIRINTIKTDVKKCIGRLEKKGFKFSKVKWCEEGFIVEKEPRSIGATTEYLMGYYYVQDSASMAPPVELSPSKEDMVSDMTAAPGGKTTHIAQIMDNKGVIVATDMDKRKIKALRSNIQRCGVENTVLIRMKAQEFADLGVKFDKILLDAPCTGEGTISKNPGRKKSLKLEDFEKYSKIQKELLGITKKILKPGGILLYSTCSLAPEENEMQVEYAVENLGFEVLNLKNKQASKGFTEFFGKEHPKYLEKCKRFFPHKHDAQGFFMAKLRKSFK